MSDWGPFALVQADLPQPLGPPDGRYLSRVEPKRIVVLQTVAAPEPVRRRFRRPTTTSSASEPRPFVSRVTVAETEPLPDPEAWLDARRGAAELALTELRSAARALTLVASAYRMTHMRPGWPDPDLAVATALRVGYGDGTAIADGRFTQAFEATWPEPGAPPIALDRFVSVLAGRSSTLACEELVLRLRADLAAGRPREAALQARIALEAVLAEAGTELADELGAALEGHREAVGATANAALWATPDADQVERLSEAAEAMASAVRTVTATRASRPGS